MALKEEVKNGSITLKDRFSIELQHDLRKGAIRYGNDYYHAKVRKQLELFTRSELQGSGRALTLGRSDFSLQEN